jgi:hypothetical protein
MKSKLFVFVLFAISWTSSISQTTENFKGFSDVKLNYNLSFISDDPFTTKLGIGIGTTYSLNKNLSIDLGITVKPTKKEIRDYDVIGDWGIIYETYTHFEQTAFFIDLPVHVNYRFLKLGPVNMFLSAGTRLFYINTTHEINIIYINQDPFYARNENSNLNFGLDIGFIESFNLTSKIAIFASQHYGQALLGFSKGFESTDLNFGLIYKFK